MSECDRNDRRLIVEFFVKCCAEVCSKFLVCVYCEKLKTHQVIRRNLVLKYKIQCALDEI